MQPRVGNGGGALDTAGGPYWVLGETLVVLFNESLRWWKVSQGYRLGQLDRSEEAVAVHDQVVDRFGEDAAPALREPVATHEG